MSGTVEAPWTPEQVAAIERWQAPTSMVHPMTCGTCRDADCECVAEDDGAFDVTPNGLTHHCGATQSWVPDVVLKWGEA